MNVTPLCQIHIFFFLHTRKQTGMMKVDLPSFQSLAWSVFCKLAFCMTWLFHLQILPVDPCDFLYAFVLFAPALVAAPATAA